MKIYATTPISSHDFARNETISLSSVDLFTKALHLQNAKELSQNKKQVGIMRVTSNTVAPKRYFFYLSQHTFLAIQLESNVCWKCEAQYVNSFEIKLLSSRQ